MSETLAARLRALMGTQTGSSVPSSRESVFGVPVGMSEDLKRILALPRRTSEISPAEVEELSELLRRPGGTMTLRPIQARALVEVYERGGLLGPIGVGSGKCVAKGAEFFDILSGRRRDVSEQCDFLIVPTVVDGKRLGTAAASSFPSGRKRCVRLELQDGSALTLSTDHPVLTARGWIEAADVTMRDLVAVPSKLPAPLKPLDITDDEVSLIAFLMADGSVSQAGTRFTDDNPTTLDEVEAVCRRLGFGTTRKDSRSRAKDIDIRGARKWRDKWDLNGLAKNKRLDPRLWGMSDRHVALFLNRFWGCDGHVSERGLECTLASEGLIDDLKFLLLRVGVRATKRYKRARCAGKEFDAWRLSFAGQEALTFLDVVGSPLGSENRARMLRESLESKKRNPNNDIVPIGRREMQEICDELGISAGKGRSRVRQAVSATGGQYVGRPKFKQFCEDYGYAGKYRSLLIDDVRWARVSSNEPVGVHDVFDLSVEGTHNFVANGIVIHNTLVTLLTPEVLESKVTVLLVPPSLKAKLTDLEWPELSKHWRIPNLAGGSVFYPDTDCLLHVVSYAQLSSAKSADILDRIKPDLIVCDEAHSVARSSARTRRFNRYLKANPGTRLVALSGTLTNRSIKDYANLAKFALGKGSPVPLDYPTLDEWSQALDDSQTLRPPGELTRFCRPGETVREGYRRRLVETPGVVATTDNRIGTALILHERKVKVPKAVTEALENLRATWVTPGGEEIMDALSFSRYARQVSCGLYYRWIWPRGEPQEVREAWLEARRDWHREVRTYLTHRAAHGMDSPMLLARAAATGRWRSECWEPWSEVKDSARPETEAVWIDDYLARDSVAWGQHHKGIIWYEHEALGRRIAELGNFPFYSGGLAASEQIIHEKGARTIVASVKAHGEGKNLQGFSTQLVTTPSSNGKVWEQLLGRMHRPGQQADEVTAHVYLHTDEMFKAMRSAVENARYIEQTLGSEQKLLYATYTWAWDREE